MEEQTTDRQLPAVPSDFERWRDHWSGQLTTALGGRGRVERERFALVLSATATEDEIEQIIDKSISYQHKTGHQETMMRFSIGDMVNELASRRDEPAKLIAEELRIAERTGRSPKTVMAWVRTAAAIPPDERHLNLRWSHFQSAASFRVPETPIERRRFIQERGRVLREASEDPVGKRWIESEMKIVQGESGTRRRKTDMRALFEYGVRLNYLDNNISELALETIGLTLTGMKNALFEFEACMINMGIIDPDKPEHPGKMPVQEDYVETVQVPPGRRGKIIEAEEVKQ